MEILLGGRARPDIKIKFTGRIFNILKSNRSSSFMTGAEGDFQFSSFSGCDLPGEIGPFA